MRRCVKVQFFQSVLRCELQGKLASRQISPQIRNNAAEGVG
jgi:hypothetical protein